MKNAKVAAMLMACSNAMNVPKSADLDDRENKLAQSFATAMNMEPPKLMATGGLTQGGKDVCPQPGVMLTNEATNGAFLDGCYQNTTRSQARNEQTGEEAQNYLYMWKHACAFTKWVPSNQFMYSGLDYNPQEMTLERFGFIGMDKRCFWGSIGVLWKRPLPVEQILPNATITTNPPQPPQGPLIVKEGQLINYKSTEGLCLESAGQHGKPLIGDCKTDGTDVWVLYDNQELQHKTSGLCLQSNGAGNGKSITLEPCMGLPTQKWGLRHTDGRPNEWFQIENIRHVNQCVDIGGYTAKKGEKIQTYGCRSTIPSLENDNFEYKWA